MEKDFSDNFVGGSINDFEVAKEDNKEKCYDINSIKEDNGFEISEKSSEDNNIININEADKNEDDKKDNNKGATDLESEKQKGIALVEGIIKNPKSYDGFEIIETGKKNDAKFAAIRLGGFLCSGECNEYSFTALGAALEKFFNEVGGKLKSSNSVFWSMIRDEIKGVNGLNNLARMFEGANLDFLKENIFASCNLRDFFSEHNIREKIGYVLSKISEDKRKSILDFIIKDETYGIRIIKVYNEIKEMSNEKIKEIFEPEKREDKQASEKQKKGVFKSLGSKIKNGLKGVFSKGNNSNKSNKDEKDGQKKQK